MECGAGGAPACFDCNICLEPVAEPVVTLCGHLYCRPCVRLWLRSGQPGHGQCPVCKATVSEDRLVRLYGRGHAAASCQDDGDGLCLHDVQQSTCCFRNQQERHGASMDMQSWVLHSNAGSVIGSVAVAALPWAFPDGQFPPRSVLLYGGRRLRRVEDSLHQIWLFLAVFALLCFLLF